jgi:hypothetical protein
MGTCKECRFWDKPTTICLKRFADVPNAEREFKPDTVRVFVWHSGGSSGESHVHQFFAGPDFGCVHFEAKVPEGAV